jgi:hypothetical protein
MKKPARNSTNPSPVPSKPDPFVATLRVAALLLLAVPGLLHGAPARVATEVVEHAAGPLMARTAVRTAQTSSAMVQYETRRVTQAALARQAGRPAGHLIPPAARATGPATRTGEVVLVFKTPRPAAIPSRARPVAPSPQVAASKPGRWKEMLAVPVGIGTGWGAYEALSSLGQTIRDLPFWIGVLAAVGLFFLFKKLIQFRFTQRKNTP